MTEAPGFFGATDAAAELRRLRDEIERLTLERDTQRDLTDWWSRRAKKAEADRDDVMQLHGEVIIERDRMQRVIDAATELVTLKDMADERDYNLLYAQTTGSLDRVKKLDVEYRGRKLQAWRDIRAALARLEQEGKG